MLDPKAGEDMRIIIIIIIYSGGIGLVGTSTEQSHTILSGLPGCG